LKDQGWDVLPVFGRAMQREGLDPNGRIILTAQSESPPNVKVETLNLIYNAVDVGVNTCKGEGWGLVNFENAACRVAQVVPNHTSCKEIFDGYAPLIQCNHVDVDTNYAREMPCPSSDHLAAILTDLYDNRDKLSAVADACYERCTGTQFDWDTVAAQFNGVFQDALQAADGEAEVGVEKEKKKKKVKREKRLVGTKG